MSGSAIAGGSDGIRSGCSRRPATTAWTGCVSRRRRSPSRPRTRWPTISRPTRRASSCRSATASASTAVSRRRQPYVVSAGDRRFEADQVVVAMSSYQRPSAPAFAGELDADIVQLHSSDYRSPAQLAAGRGADRRCGQLGRRDCHGVGARGRHVVMSGSDTGKFPFRLDGSSARHVLLPLPAPVRLPSRADHRARRSAGKCVRSMLHAAVPLIRVKARRSRRRRRRAGAARGRRPRRPAAARGWARPRCRQRHLVHAASGRASTGSTCRSSTRRAIRVHRARRGGEGARPVLRRAAVPLRDVLGDGAGRRPRCGVCREADRRAGQARRGRALRQAQIAARARLPARGARESERNERATPPSNAP